MRMMNWIAAAAFVIAAAACDQGDSKAVAQAGGDMMLGAANAPVTLIEYAAPSCPYCKLFHDQVVEPIKTKYIDTGKVKFIFREFPSHNPPVDVAVFQIARCAGKDKYFSVIDGAFAAQEAIERAANTTGAKPELLKLAQANGLSEAKAEACIKDEAGIKRIRDGVEAATKEFDVHGTPTIVLNGMAIDGNDQPDAYTLAGLSARIDQALAASTPASATAPKP
jgi:protein-disulfide isomerase